MNIIKKPEDLFSKIDSVFSRASKIFDEMPSEAMLLARNTGQQKNIDMDQNQRKSNVGPKIK